MKSERANPDKVLIDRMIDWRRMNRPNDESEIKTTLPSKELHKALGLPLPRENEVFPASVLYRGYRILAKAKEPAPA